MEVIFGINPVLEALKSRNGMIRKIVIAKGRGGEILHKIINLAEYAHVQVEFRERGYLDKQTGQKNHQGVIGVRETFTYVTVDDVIANRHVGFDSNLILVLDGITDPQNLGSLIRTAHCCGVNGVIIPENRSATVTGAVIKASAGAACHTPVSKVASLVNAIEYLKEKGFWIYGTDPSSSNKVSTFDYRGHIGLVMGSEGRGMRPLIKKKCDFLLSVPVMGKIDSLNVSVAAGIVFYDILKAWGKV